MAGEDCELNSLKIKVTELETELSVTKERLAKSQEELEKSAKKLCKTQRQLDKSNSYNDDLCKQIESLSQEIQDFRHRRRDGKHVGTQAIAEEILTELGDKPLPQWETAAALVEETKDKPSSIAESLKQTAEATLAQSGFVFDEKTGLYYDYTSGYYYNCEHGLYYDPASGTYFYYDEESGEYKFHSQVAPQQYSCPVNETSVQQDHTDHRRKRAKDKKERGSNDHKKRKKRKKEDKENSEADVRSKKYQSKKRRHKSHHRRGDKSSRLKSASDDLSRDRKKHSQRKDNSHSHNEGKCNVSSHKDRKTRKTEIKIAETSSRDKQSDNTDDVENYEIDHSQEVHKNDETVDSTATDVILVSDEQLSEGELSSDSLATGESELESGELTSDSEPDSSASESGGEDEEDMGMSGVAMETFEEEQEDMSGSWPPCIRVMVTESDCLQEGTLFIITCDGATIGREKDMNHLIRIPDINVSKLHAEVQYDYEGNNYIVIDCGSQNGTFLNKKFISQGKNERSVRALSHGDTLQFANTILLLHIHPGTDTCDDCEPGQVISKLQAQQKASREVSIQSKADRHREQKKQLKQIKKKYGLENSAYVDNVAAINNPAYQDKAATRRREVGSDNPHLVDEAPASVMKPISTENKGRKLLAKMGWKEGQGLGKDNAGIAEPINVMLRTNQSAGLGSRTAVEKTLDDVHSAKKSQRWLQAQQRYNQLGKKPVDLTQPSNVSFTFRKGPTVNLKQKVDLGTGESESGEEDRQDMS